MTVAAFPASGTAASTKPASITQKVSHPSRGLTSGIP